MTMFRRLLPIAVLLFASAACARDARIPLDPATLGGADIFTDAEARVAQAAAAAGLAFVSDPRPLPPQVLLTLDTADGKIQKRRGILFWRGDMLPDQLAPGETGTLIRRHQARNGAWRTLRAQGLVVRVTFGAAQLPAGRTRQQLAQAMQDAVGQMLAPPG